MSARGPKPASAGDADPALVILAAGLSSRFGRPKQLEPVGPGGHALLDYALHDASLAGFGRFALVIQESMRPEFERHLAPAAAEGADIVLVPQRLALAGVVEDPPPRRVKPWGTGFAVLAAARHLNSCFAVCNADDFYGRDAYAALFREMPRLAMSAASRLNEPAVPEPAVPGSAPAPAPASVRAVPVRAVTVTYPLGATLSERGGVSRGICRVGPDGFLAGLDEGLDLQRQGARVAGRTAAGEPMSAGTDAPACMSLWGFASGIGDCLADGFADFLASDPDSAAEFYMTEAVAALVASGRVRCRVLRTTEQWLGVTFPGDRAEVAAALRAMVESKRYPRRLWPLPKGRPQCS